MGRMTVYTSRETRVLIGWEIFALRPVALCLNFFNEPKNSLSQRTYAQDFWVLLSASFEHVDF
jgi:hypothetical protein